MLKFRLTLFFVLFLAALVSGADAIGVTILQTTDIHGSISAHGDRPGFLRIGAAIERERSAAESRGDGEILLIDCGDLTQGSFEVLSDNGAAMVAGINFLKYDVWVPGNHDFDFGPETLRKNLSAFRGAVLAANLRLDGGPPCVSAWKMFERNGIRIAVIGCTSGYLREWIAPAQLRGVTVSDAGEALLRVMPEVRKAKPDLIVFAVHQGEYTGARLTGNPEKKSLALSSVVRETPEIALVLGGHSHQTVTGKKWHPATWFVQAPAIGGGLAKIRIRFEAETRKVEEIESELVEVGETDLPELKKLLADEMRSADRTGHRTVAMLPESLKLGPVKGERNPPLLASLLAEASARETGAPIAFSPTLSAYGHSGGRLTEFQLFLLVPYENFLGTLNLSPAAARAIIEEQEAVRPRNQAMAAYGLTWKTDRSGRVTALFLPDGSPWTDETKVLRAAFGSFALSGAGGRLPVLKKIAASPEAGLTETAITARAALGRLLAERYPAREKRAMPSVTEEIK